MASVALQIGTGRAHRERHEVCTNLGIAVKERRAGKEQTEFKETLMRKPPAKEKALRSMKAKAGQSVTVKAPRRTKKTQTQEDSNVPATISLKKTPPKMPIPQVAQELKSIPVQPIPAPQSLITREEESRFATRDRVVLENLPLVRVIAVRVHENLPVHVDLDDLIHAGIMGLFDAATKFDPDKNVVFSSYAKHRIKGAILDSLRQLDWASRDLRRRHKQVEQVTRDLAGELHRNPTESEVAARMGVEVDRWRQMMLDLRNVGLVSASTRAQDNEDMPAPDFPTSPDSHPDTMCAKEELKSMLKTALHTLPERYQRVVLLYYSNELTMKEIGNMLGINESRVSQIHKAALEKMANALGQAGISSAAAF
jgi:RNA polymerase sigma factor FliA